MRGSVGTFRPETSTNGTTTDEPPARVGRTRMQAYWRATLGRMARPLHHRSVDALRAALVARDADGVAALLHDDVAVVVDPGPGSDAPLRILTGRATATAALLHGTRTGRADGLDVRSVNGQAGLVLRGGGETVAVICVDLTGGRVSALWIRLQPDQLRHGHHI